MGKSLHNKVFDQGLEYLKNNSSKMIVCSAQPTTYLEATSTYALADVAMSSTDYTIADGDTSGRKITAAAKSTVTIDASGTGTHIAHVNDTGTELLWVSTTPSQGLTSGGTVDIGTHKHETADPA